jgi:GxxExxY protein
MLGAPVKTLKVSSPLSDEEEVIVRVVLGSAIHVHRELGPGLLEHFYQRALCLELNARGVAFEAEHPVTIRYGGETLGVQRLDLLIERRIVVEVKSVERLELVHMAQVISYLRAARLRAGLLLNFNAAPLTIRRVVV